jgi:DNA invertase Pin-like site-specific DNA recombinase
MRQTVSGPDTLGYVRVSTEQQATEQKTSLSDQKRLITEFGTKLGRVLDPQMIFADPGVSGATAEGRPGFMAMLNYCQSNQRPVNARGMIVVLNDSRFGRFDDLEEAGHWRFVLKGLGWLVKFVESDDITDPLARSVTRLMASAQATEYRLNLKRTAKRAARSTAELGRWQQEAPLGYRRLVTRTDGAQRVLDIGQRKSADEYSRLTPGPESEQAIIRWMFETYAAGTISLGAMSRELASRFPERRWSNSTVGSTLKNPAYAGDVVWCRRVTDKAERQERTVRDRSEWVVVRDAHPALVERRVWDSVQERMATNKRHTRATAGNYALAGLIRCKQCGHHFAGGGGPKGPADDPDRFRFYRDTGNTARVPVCGPPMLTIRKQWLERKVIAVIARLAAQREVMAEIEETMRSVLYSACDTSGEKRRTLEREHKLLGEQRKRLLDAISRGTVREHEAAANLAEIRSRMASVETEIERTRFADRASEGLRGETERMVRLAQDFPTQALRLKGAELREVLRPWIKDAVVDKGSRMLTLTLWRVPGIANAMHLNNSPVRD